MHRKKSQIEGEGGRGSAGSRWTAASIVQVRLLPLALEILLTLAHESAPSLRCAKILLQFEVVLEYIAARTVFVTRISSHRLVKIVVVTLNIAVSNLNMKRSLPQSNSQLCSKHSFM